MDLGRLFKWLVIAGLVFFAWKYLLPWMKQEQAGSPTTSAAVASASRVGDDSCAGMAERASEKWGSGLAQFVNPPYDLNAWTNFKNDVDSRIYSAESKCSCAKESCNKVREAMSELRGLVSDMDTAIRTGGSPGGIVQRMERVDILINDARDLQISDK